MKCLNLCSVLYKNVVRTHGTNAYYMSFLCSFFVRVCLHIMSSYRTLTGYITFPGFKYTYKTNRKGGEY